MLATSYAAPGDLDLSFGSGGVVTANLSNKNEYGSGIAMQGDGKIVVAGRSFNGYSSDIALARYAVSGAVDTTFGSGGMVTTSGLPDTYIGNNVAVQNDGMIVVAGAAGADFGDGLELDFLLVRYTASGALDTGFSTDGIVTTHFASANSVATDVAVQGDGKIVVVGYANSDFAVARYHPNGTPDMSFGNGGTVVTPMSGRASGVRIQSDGKIFVVGNSFNGSDNDIALVRYNANGTLDGSFGNGGKVITKVGSGDDFGASVAVQGNGKIVVTGQTWNGSNYDVALVRYESNGTPDASFGAAGKVALPVGNGDDFGQSVVVQDDGRIVVTGTSTQLGEQTLVLARFTAGGALDQSFATGGIRTTTFISFDGAGDSVLQSDGKIIATFTTGDSANADIALVRCTTSGTLDSTFGTGGIVARDFGGEDVANGVALQSDGKIVIAGISGTSFPPDFALMRYTASGVRDTSFGANGITRTPVATNITSSNDMALQRDGKIIMAGSIWNGAGYNVATVRYTVNGVLDATFGSGGLNTSIAGSGANVALQTDGKIVFAGSYWDGDDHDFLVVRYTAGGALDSSFSNNGRVTSEISGGFNDSATSVAVQADGKIVAAGYAEDHDFAVVRYLSNGTRDASFGTNGVVVTPIGASFAISRGLALQSDGKIVVVGYSRNASGNNDVAMVRYGSNGVPDASFGTSGIVVTPIGSSHDSANAVALQSDGKIIIAGSSRNANGNDDLALLRYTANGALDPGFGTGGIVTTAVGSGHDVANSVALQSDGKIIVAGSSTFAARDFLLARYEGDGPTDSDADGLLDQWEYNHWRTINGHSALDDEDGDGSCELLEQAFGLNPTQPDSGALPTAVLEGSYLTMTIAKQAGVAYEVQSAGTLLPSQPESFSAASTTVLINNATTLRVRDNFPISAPGSRFMRVKVTAAPRSPPLLMKPTARFHRLVQPIRKKTNAP